MFQVLNEPATIEQHLDEILGIRLNSKLTRKNGTVWDQYHNTLVQDEDQLPYYEDIIPMYFNFVLLCILFLSSMQFSTYGFDPNATKYGLVKTWGSKGTENGNNLTVPL